MTEVNTQLRAELENRIRFETLITDISTRFISLPFGKVDTEIERALKQILDFFEGDRCGILEVQQDKRFVRVTHICYAEGIEPVSKDINLADLFPWCYEQLIHGQPVIVERMADLPSEARQDQISWVAMATQSNLTIPLSVRRAFSFCLPFNPFVMNANGPGNSFRGSGSWVKYLSVHWNAGMPSRHFMTVSPG